MSTVQPPASTYQPQTTFPEVTFALKNIGPPSSLYVGREDKLFVTSYNSASGFSVEVHTRMLLPSGVVVPGVQIHVPNSDRSSKTSLIPLAEGFLLNVLVIASAGSAKRGQCYVVVGLSRGDGPVTINHQVMTQGYVFNAGNLVWPGGPMEQPTQGLGYVRTYNGTQPAAGAEINEVVPTGARWRLVALRNNLTTAVAVANRKPAIKLVIGALGAAFSPSPVTQTASLSWAYDTHIGMSSYTAADTTDVVMPIPASILLPAGAVIATATVGIQAADQWAAPNVTIEEWIEP